MSQRELRTNKRPASLVGTATKVASIMAAISFCFTLPADAGSKKDGIQNYIEGNSEKIFCTKLRAWNECEGGSISYEQVPNGLDNYGTCVATAGANLVVNPTASCRAPTEGLVGYFSGRLEQNGHNGVKLTHLHDVLEDMAADNTLCPGLDWDWSEFIDGPDNPKEAAKAILSKMQLQDHQPKNTDHMNPVVAPLVYGQDRHAVVIADYSYDGSLTEDCYFEFLTWGSKRSMPCLQLSRIVKGRLIYRGDDE